jgi:hypothetical protein
LSWLQRNCDSLSKLWRQQRNSFAAALAAGSETVFVAELAACSEPVLAAGFYNKPPRQK